MLKQYEEWIGKTVKKKSGKPFKSKQKEATVKAITVNPYNDDIAFSFFEDNSIVSCDICEILEIESGESE